MIDFERGELIPESLRAIVPNLIDVARGIARDGKDIAAMAWAGSSARGEIEIVPIFLARNSDEARMLMIGATRILKADFVFQIQETWGFDAKGKTRAEMDAMRARYGGVRNYPGSYDAITFLLETSLGNWMCSPRIDKRPGSSKQRVFASELTFWFAGFVEGRLTGLLQPLGNAQ
jgi:hypothetical protein